MMRTSHDLETMGAAAAVTGAATAAIAPADARGAARRPASMPPAPGFSILGDSISTLQGFVPAGWRVHYEGEASVPGVGAPQDTWWGKVIEHFGGHLVANSSYSGSVVEGFGFPAGVSDERLAALAGDDGSSPDVVLVFMGINDYGWGGGRNQVMGGSLSASASPDQLGGPCEVERVVGARALERFEAAYARVLDGVRSRFPSATTWCLTLCPGHTDAPELSCYKYSIKGIELEEYNGAIRRAAKSAGALVADIAAYGVAYDAVDACHPSALGMVQIADMAVAQMEGRATGRPPASVVAAPRAERTCPEAHCAGCPLDDADPAHWNIACPGPRA